MVSSLLIESEVLFLKAYADPNKYAHKGWKYILHTYLFFISWLHYFNNPNQIKY